MEKAMCTLEKRGNLFILTITGDDVHRLNPTLLDSLREALSKVRTQCSNHSALITTSQGKFFSNGYDLNWAGSDQERFRLMSSKFCSLTSEIINFPMPTIAAIIGHASAAGFRLALSHDYIIMRKDRGFLYMSELDIGMTFPGWFVSLIKSKMGSPKAWREVLLTAAKITAERGVELGIVHSAHDGVAKTFEAAVGLGEGLIRKKWDGHVYPDNRRVVFAELVGALTFNDGKGDFTKIMIFGRIG